MMLFQTQELFDRFFQGFLHLSAWHVFFLFLPSLCCHTTFDGSGFVTSSSLSRGATWVPLVELCHRSRASGVALAVLLPYCNQVSHLFMHLLLHAGPAIYLLTRDAVGISRSSCWVSYTSTSSMTPRP